MKISIELGLNKDILNINNTSENAAMEQSKKEGWILVESNPAFSVNDAHKWTVREKDNVLVHINTNQTPEEEKNAVITNLTLQNLQQANEITELKKISTTQALQSLQDAKDKEEQQKVITTQTVQLLEVQKSIADIKSATN